MTQQYQNDLSLLRPFNLEAAKNGEEICFVNDFIKDRKFIAEHNGQVVVAADDRGLQIGDPHLYNMKPICWVEGKPVYKGDVLYGKTYPDYRYNVKGISSSGDVLSEENETNSFCERPSDLTWNKPKQKQKVTRKVWINVYPGEDYVGAYWSEGEANGNSAISRIACVETEIEYKV